MQRKWEIELKETIFPFRMALLKVLQTNTTIEKIIKSGEYADRGE